MTADRSNMDVAWAETRRSGGMERRRRERIETIVRTTVRAPGSDIAPLRARVIDISEHGAKLLTRRRLVEGATIELDLECEMPLRVHLGYDADSLVIDGPMHTHLVRLRARVVRCDRRKDRLHDAGVEFFDDEAWHDMQVVRSFLDHLRDYESW